MNIQRTILSLVSLLASLAATLDAAAQGTTAFTYQGQLRDGGTNASGTYTMVFKLYDALAGGSQAGGAISNVATLANGLFTVNLDFGAEAFKGAARWLDITIQAGTNAPETLSPRVQVLPVPYALFAPTAGTVTNGAITSAQLADGSVTSSKLNSNIVFGPVFLAPGTPPHGLLIFEVPTNAVANFVTNFTVPAGVFQIFIEAWGAGGGGGGVDVNWGKGGGGGGYARGVVNVEPFQTYGIEVGLGGAGGVGGVGVGGAGRGGTVVIPYFTGWRSEMRAFQVTSHAQICFGAEVAREAMDS